MNFAANQPGEMKQGALNLGTPGAFSASFIAAQ